MKKLNHAIFIDLTSITYEKQYLKIKNDLINSVKKLSENYFIIILVGSNTAKKILENGICESGITKIEIIESEISKEAGDCLNKEKINKIFNTVSNSINISIFHSFFISSNLVNISTAKNSGLYGIFLIHGESEENSFDYQIDTLMFQNFESIAGWIQEHPNKDEDLHNLIYKSAEIIKSGGVVAFPTETVYGLGANALDEIAVAKIFEIKQRPSYDPLIVHICESSQVYELAKEVPEDALSLMQAFWPGPLTIILPKNPKVPDIVTSGLQTVAIRKPFNQIALDLLKLSETPIAAPSANLFGRTSPTCAEHVRVQIGGKCDCIIDGGSCRVGVESTVVSLAGEDAVLLRPGGITPEQIQSVIKRKLFYHKLTKDKIVEGPGMMKSHYATRTPLILTDKIEEYFNIENIGLILFKKTLADISGKAEVLAKNGDLRTAAANLFGAMRRLDELNLKYIVAERVPEHGIGLAINDRLTKAAAESKL